jgi:hypothetical protein
VGATNSKPVVVRCKCCGKCCIVLFRGRWESCKFLRIIGKKTYCRCFSSRLGKVIGKNQYCGLRKDTPFDYPDCPYNTGKPIHPAYLNIRNGIVKSSRGGNINCEEEEVLEGDAFTPDRSQDGE